MCFSLLLDSLVNIQLLCLLDEAVIFIRVPSLMPKQPVQTALLHFSVRQTFSCGGVC